MIVIVVKLRLLRLMRGLTWHDSNSSKIKIIETDERSYMDMIVIVIKLRL